MSGDSERDSPRHPLTEREKFENWLESTKPEDDWSPLAVWCASAELKDKEIAKLRAELAEYLEMKPVAWVTSDMNGFPNSIATIHESTVADIERVGYELTPLYAHPPKEKL